MEGFEGSPEAEGSGGPGDCLGRGLRTGFVEWRIVPRTGARSLGGARGWGPRWKSGKGLRADNGIWKRAVGMLRGPWRRQAPGVAARRAVAEGTPDAIAPPSPGAAALMLLLPATMFHLLLVAHSGPAHLLGPPPYLPGPEVLWSPQTLLLWLAWLGLQAALYLLPARKVWTRLAGEAGGGRGLRGREDTLTPYQSRFVPAGGRGTGIEGQESPALPH